MPALARATFVFLSLCVACLCHADAVRAYPDPGYARLGIYGGGHPAYTDYNFPKISLGDTFPGKKEWWASVREQRERGDGEHDVYILSWGKGAATPAQARQRVGAWLAPEPDIETYPQLIPAVCLAEENTRDLDPVLDGLARHIRETYGIPVFQWYTDPAAPNPNLAADGWVFDAYFWEYPRFRRYLMKYVVLGKPVVCTLWATDPHWPQWRQFPSTTDLINNVEDQFRTCMEFNVSTALFAVAGPYGSFGTWRGAPGEDMIALRNWVQVKRAQMHAFQPGDLPLASANFSSRERHAVQVGGDPDAPSVYEEGFAGFQWLHDANIEGLLDLKLSSAPEQVPGILLAETQPGRATEAALTYRFESYLPLAGISADLAAAAPAASKCRNELAVSFNDADWPFQTVQAGNTEIETATVGLTDDEIPENRRTFFLRVRMTNHATGEGTAGNRLDSLRVQCVHKPPAAGAAATLARDANGRLLYDDDFSTSRWRHFGRVYVRDRHDRGGYRGSGFWIGLGPGVSSTRLIQRVSSPSDLKELSVSVSGEANTTDLGGRLDLGVAPRGGEVRWQTRTEDLLDRTGGRFRGELTLTVPPEELESLRDFDVHVTLRSTSGLEGGGTACASVWSLKIRGK